MPSFVTIWMLAGTALVAVPVVLHLLMWQQPKHLEFPALRFIRQRRDVNRRRLRLRHWLLLLLRMAAIGLLAVALARPKFFSSGFMASGDAPVAAALVFDNGPRMEYKHQNETRISVARALGKSLLAQFPTGSQLVVFDRQSDPAVFDLDPKMSAVRIDQLTTTAAPRPLIAKVDQALALLEKSDKPRKEVYLFTDLARTDWGGEQTAAWQKRLRENPGVSFYLLDVGVEKPQNFGLGEISLSSQVVSPSGLLQIRSELICEGPAGSRSVRLFFIGPDGHAQKKGEATFDCQADSSTLVEFAAGALPPGTHQGYLEIVGADALPIDDRRYFTVRIAPAWRLLIVAPPPAATRTRILTQILAPEELQLQGAAEFECDVIEFDALSSAPLPRYDAVWLVDPGALPDPLWRKLADYAAEGRGVAIALGGRAGPTGEGLNVAAAQGLLPGRLKFQVNTGESEVYLAPDRLEHPVFAIHKQSQGTIPWNLDPVFRYWDINPVDESAQVLLQYGNGRPALIEQRLGSGRVLMLTTSLVPSAQRPWNQLFDADEKSWPGLALLRGMARYLVGRVEEKTNYLVEDVAELRLGKDEQFDTFQLTTPLGDTVKVSQQEGIVRFDDTKAIGQYQLKAGSESPVRRGFSVNLNPAETRLGRIDAATLRKSLDKDQLQIARDAAELTRQRRLGDGRQEWELYPWLLLVIGLVVVGETLLSNFFYRKTT